MMPQAVLDEFEPDAKAFAVDVPDTQIVLVPLASIAISLRRIADSMDTAPVDAACKWCRFAAFGGFDSTTQGICRLRPPVATGGMMSDPETIWPKIDESDFCGDFVRDYSRRADPPPTDRAPWEPTGVACSVCQCDSCACIPF